MSIFDTPAVEAEALRANRLVIVARTHLAGLDLLDDDYLFSKLTSSAALLERKLRVFLEPVEMLPAGATQAEIDAFEQATTTAAPTDEVPFPEPVLTPIRWAEDPGYDMSPEHFDANHWGFLALRQKPVIAVHSMQFIYPVMSSVFEVPTDWFRVDKKYGHINLVPGHASVTAPLSAIMLQFQSGRNVPLMVQVRYRAGLKNLKTDYPEIWDVLQKMAVLSMIEDSFPAASTSQSIDGMSQSSSLDVSKLGDTIDAKVDAIRQSLHGVRMGVC